MFPYRLKVHAEKDNDHQKLIGEEISKYVTSSKPSPVSLRKIYNLAQNLLKSRNNGDMYMYQQQTEGYVIIGSWIEMFRYLGAWPKICNIHAYEKN